MGAPPHGRCRRRPSGPSRRAGRVPSRTTSGQNIVLDTQAEPSPSAASATQEVLHAGAHRDQEHARSAAARRVVGIGVHPSVTRQGTTRYGARRSTSPRRSRRATGSVGEAVASRSARHGVAPSRRTAAGASARLDQDEPPGLVWCGAGAVTAAATARTTAAASTGSAAKSRTVAPATSAPRGARAGTCPRPAGGRAPRRPVPSSRQRRPSAADDGRRARRRACP